MSDREIPASLRRAGLGAIRHELPAGFEVNFHADFCRIFKEDIERKGQGQPAAVAPAAPAGAR